MDIVFIDLEVKYAVKMNTPTKKAFTKMKSKDATGLKGHRQELTEPHCIIQCMNRICFTNRW